MSHDSMRHLRAVLPIVEEAAMPASSVDIRKQTPEYSPRPDVRPPGGAPNVVIVLLDDMGFGAPSIFGGPCHMPVAERLAGNGLSYTRFHTTGICSPTRAALLTGRNHHSVGMGYVTEMTSSVPGYTGRIPPTAASIARILGGNGYATGIFGKSHETPRNEITPVGPFDRWPTVGLGFDKFYGFIGGHNNQWSPALFDGTTPIDPPSRPEDGYHLSEDIVRQAIGWVRDVRALTPDRPFLCYLPFGATHAPFHVPQEWVTPYRGKFDHGWNRQREITLERQKQLGVVPHDAQLAPWAPGVPMWDELGADEQRAASMLMEVYAAFAEHTDAQVGRFVDALSEMQILDDTVIFYILGDNGASPEGGLAGAANMFHEWNAMPPSASEVISSAGRLGGPDTWPHYPAGWALAMDTPYQWTKQIPSHYGGTRNGMIVHWPARISGRGELRHQWHHVIDIFPTILEAADIPAPTSVDGAAQQRVEGVSMCYSFDAAGADERRITQYFEVGGSRGIYHNGWVACTVHRESPWNVLASEPPDFMDDTWQLYDTTVDWAQAHDLADEYPLRLAELKELFLIEAARNQAFPLDDRAMAVRRNSSQRRTTTSMTLHGRSRRIPHDAIPNVIGAAFSLTACITTPDADVKGVICAQGGKFTGYSFFFREGRLHFCYNVGNRVISRVSTESPIVAGAHKVSFVFIPDSDRLGSGGSGVISVDGVAGATGRIERTPSFMFPTGEDFNVGVDPLTPVTTDYPAWDNAFTGVVDWVRIEVSPRAPITDEHRSREAMATQ